MSLKVGEDRNCRKNSVFYYAVNRKCPKVNKVKENEKRILDSGLLGSDSISHEPLRVEYLVCQ